MANVALEDGRASSTSSGSNRWMILGSKIPKSEIVFFVQVILIYIVVITSIVNISLGSTEQHWIVLLSSCLGYLLPSPSLKYKTSDYVHHFTQ